MTVTYRWTVVERAGYIDERERQSLPTRRAAQAWLDKHYHPDEIEELSVELRLDGSDGSQTYEFS